MAVGSRTNQMMFAQSPRVEGPRSSFDRSFGVKDAFYMDDLVPIFVDEILPGDTCNVKMHTFARLSTQVVPILDNIYMDYFFFFVPNRLVWDNWENFMGARGDTETPVDYIVPKLDPFLAGQPSNETIFDKFGLPVLQPGTYQVNNALPFRAYNKIYKDWFYPSAFGNNTTGIEVPTDDGPDDWSLLYSLKKRYKKLDYFSSALPWPQRGPALVIPMAGSAPVVTNSNIPTFTGITSGTANQQLYNITGSNNGVGLANSSTTATQQLKFGNESGLEADLGDAAGTINALRQAFQIQRMLEIDATGGTRYTEILWSHFQVISPDFRLQRSEYLGGGTERVNIHPIASTAGTTDQPLASLGAIGTTSSHNIGFTKSFVEHGYVIGLACARGEISYQGGLNKMWNKSTRYDFFWPELQQLGEQTILKKELNLTGNSVIDEAVFGYAERYAEYRFRPSEIHGKFRSVDPQSLDVWHLAQDYGFVAQNLMGNFLQYNTPMRSQAVTTEPSILFDCYYRYKHVRRMMAYSVPASLGRF